MRIRNALKVFADLGVGSGPDHETETYHIERGAIREARAALDAVDSNASVAPITEADIRAHVGDGVVPMREVASAVNGILAERTGANASADARLREATTGQLFTALLSRINFDGMDPRAFSLAELHGAIKGAEWPKPLRDDLLSVISALDRASGDTDPPDIGNDEECKSHYPIIWAMRKLCALRDVLFQHHRASDSEKQGETTKSIPVQDAEPANVAGRTGGAHPPTGANPSDRPADVTVSELTAALEKLDRQTVTFEDMAIAFLRAFTVGRR